MGKLITETQMSQIPDLYETERSLNPICHIKLFTPEACGLGILSSSQKKIKALVTAMCKAWVLN